MRRIIFAWNYSQWGGAQIYFLALIKEARKQFEPIVVLPQNTDPQFISFLKSEDIRFETFSGSIDLAPKFGIFEKVRRHITRSKSEYAMLKKIREIGLQNTVVHTDISPGQSLFSLIWLAIRTHVFITHHNAQPSVPEWRRVLWKIKYGIISQFKNFHAFAANQHAAKYYRHLYQKRAASELIVTYASIDPAEIDEAISGEFEKEKMLDTFGIRTPFVVLTVGQFVDRKGRWTLLDAARRLREKRDDVTFVWVAPTELTAQETQKIAEFGLGDSFRLIKSSDIGDHKSVLSFFRIADIFVLPSYIEGLPIALLEAMAIGIPSISTNVNGIPEAIIHEQTGLLIEPDDRVALERSVLRLLSAMGLRNDLGREGKWHVRTMFDQQTMAKMAVDEYLAAAASLTKV